MATAPNNLNQDHSLDALIVGAGMVGAAAAIGLTQQGYKVAVIDAADLSGRDLSYSPSFDERSTALSFGSRYILEGLGVWDRLAPHLTDIGEIHVSEKGRLGSTRMNAEDYQLQALGYVAPNQAIGAAMLARLDELGIALHSPCSIDEVQAQAGGYCVRLSGHEQAKHCRLLLLVDGAHSQTAAKLSIEHLREPYQQHALIANVEVALPHQNVAYERFTKTGPLALLPLQGQRMALVWTQPDEHLEQVMNASDAEFLRTLDEQFGGRMGGFTKVGQRQSYPLVLSRAREHYRPHLMLLGNAAHSLHPVAGQGFNLALRGLSALLDVTANSPVEQLGELTQLAQAASVHASDLKLTVSASDALVKGFSNDHLVLSLMRDLGLVGLNNAPALKRRFAEQAMGLGGRRFTLQLNNA